MQRGEVDQGGDVIGLCCQGSGEELFRFSGVLVVLQDDGQVLYELDGRAFRARGVMSPSEEVVDPNSRPWQHEERAQEDPVDEPPTVVVEQLALF
jgi:hypothetical protein